MLPRCPSCCVILYCLPAPRDFDASVPHRFVLMGIPLVIWKDPTASSGSSGSSSTSEGWHVFTDACPHRLVPLSEGRITPGGRLECPYVSGWLQRLCERLTSIAEDVCFRCCCAAVLAAAEPLLYWGMLGCIGRSAQKQMQVNPLAGLFYSPSPWCLRTQPPTVCDLVLLLLSHLSAALCGTHACVAAWCCSMAGSSMVQEAARLFLR